MWRRGWGAIVIVGFLAALFGFALVTYLVSEKKTDSTPSQSRTTSNANAPLATTQKGEKGEASANNNQETQAAATESDDDSFMSRVFGNGRAFAGNPRAENWTIVIPRILARLTLAALLAAMLAFRPRRESRVPQRTLYVAQTQILLAVVASALMMIVGDNAARAFGIFAAVSLVRFRTNIRDPKEITVLLISLSLGLATGVGRWDLAVILGLFVLPLLWLLESKEHEQVQRSMELTVKTYNTDVMQETLKQVFQRHGFNAELRQIDPPDAEEPMGCIQYSINMSLSVSTDKISEEIRAANPENVDSIEWEPTKESSYIYQ
jgi:uncharacterized membrane protein YhiD involved in acid resistance